jgi:cytidylate kinase
MYAPRDWRIHRVVEEHGLDERTAAAQVDRIDRARGEYMRAYYDVDWANPETYDLAFDTSTLGLQRGADLIVRAAQDG